jgi:hypothetical protein
MKSNHPVPHPIDHFGQKRWGSYELSLHNVMQLRSGSLFCAAWLVRGKIQVGGTDEEAGKMMIKFVQMRIGGENESVMIEYRRLIGFLWWRALPMLALACSLGCGHRRPATIMVITPTGGLECWEDFNHEVEASARAFGINTELAAPQAVTDYTEQAQMVETAISRQVQELLFPPRISLS